MQNDEWFNEAKDEWEAEEAGSDELLADEQLRLPESASILVRLHAVRAWLERRRQETIIEEGEAALALQAVLAAPALNESQGQLFMPRRRREKEQEEQLQRARQAMLTAQQRRSAYEEAQTLLEECVTHTSGERVLVEYYLALEDLVQAQQAAEQPIGTPWWQAMADVQHRIEQVGVPEREED
jgi:uncharacterized protein (DUF1684 family)